MSLRPCSGAPLVYLSRVRLTRLALLTLATLLPALQACSPNDNNVVDFDTGPAIDRRPPVDSGVAATDDVEVIADSTVSVDRGEAVDAGFDAGFDAGTDLGRDAGSGPLDAGRDSGSGTVDVGRDTGSGPVDVGRDTGPAPVDAGPSRCAQPPTPIDVAVAPFSGAVIARVRAIRGASSTNRATVFAKIGDSITEAGGFLTDIGQGWFSLGNWGCLEGTISYFRQTSLSGGNSFTRASVAAMGGWVSSQIVQGDPNSPLQAELNATRPAYAIIMVGTNDLDRGGPDPLITNLTRIAVVCETFGTVPVLSTIPDRRDQSLPASRVAEFNDRIRALAASRNLPLIDYWAAMRPLPNNGIDTDGIHPSIFRRDGVAEAGYLTDAALQFGYNMRNLTAVLMLDRLRALSP
ncbi:MAG: SGNH/GDSL hydrolase family protein [Myxococcales bacterium]|nr:SGNH/GDSL hydrolase family protein [Myxococcales bacterium]